CGARRSKVRVLEHANVRDEQPAIVPRQCDAEWIAAERNVTDDGIKVVGFGDSPKRVDARLNLRHIDHVELKAALIRDVEIPSRSERHASGKRALETLRWRWNDGERAIERMGSAVEVHRPDDLARNDIGDPDVAVLTTREKYALAVGRERHAQESGVDVDALHHGCDAGDV